MRNGIWRKIVGPGFTGVRKTNLALCHEMRGDLKEAYEWAHKSYDLFKRNSGDNDKSTKLLELYVQALAERIRSDKKLNVQFGED